MADATYQPKVYRKQGGDELVVASGGTITVEDGGILALADKINFASRVPSTETTGSIITTGSTWLSHTAVGGCAVKLLCANAAASGDYATARLRARSDAAGSTECVNASASAGAENHGDLYALRGYAQPNAYGNNNGANIVCGVYSCIDAGGVSSGRRWSAWFDDHSTSKASGGHYLVRLSQNGTVAIDGAISVYTGGRLPVLFNIEDAAGFLTDADASLTVQSGAIAIKTPAGTKYLPLYNAAA